MCLLIIVGAVGVGSAYAIEAAQERETFRALARATGTGPSGQTTISINIDRWSSDEEHETIFETIMTGDNEEVADQLSDFDSIGFLRTTGRTQGRGTGSWQLRYAREMWDDDGTRIIRLASNRPISFVEAVRQPRRTSDAQTTLIELRVDENGEGEGVLMAGVEFTIDAKTNMLTLSHISSSPVRLEQVRPQ